MAIIDLGSVRGLKGDTGAIGETGATGSRGIGISSIEQTSNGFKICLTDGRDYNIEIAHTDIYNLTLITDKTIISYIDDDTAYLTMTLTKNGAPASYEDIKFFINGYEYGTLRTDVNGVVVFPLASSGMGDFTFRAESHDLSDSVTIEDCLDYQPMTSNAKEEYWDIPSAVKNSTFGYSTNGWKYGNASSYSRIIANYTLSFPFSLELIVNDVNDNQLSPIGVIIGSSYIFMQISNNKSKVELNVAGTKTSYNVASTMPKKLRMEITSSNIKLYLDDNLLGTANHSLSGTIQPALETGGNRWIEIKEFKIKGMY